MESASPCFRSALLVERVLYAESVTEILRAALAAFGMTDPGAVLSIEAKGGALIIMERTAATGPLVRPGL